MDRLLDRLASLATAVKIAMLAILLMLTGLIYYSLFYSTMRDEHAQLRAREVQLRKEKGEYEGRRKQYLAYQNEINGLLEQQKELLRVLPRKDDIEQFIESVNAQVELSGLARVSSVREAPVPEELYLRIPIKMSALGTYHQLNRFFKNVGDLQRIVTIGDLHLKHVDAKTREKEAAGGELLQAEFVATTFQLLDRPTTAAAGGTAASTGGKR